MTTEPNTIDRIMLEQIKEIEQRDESQIIAELAGETVGDYIYELEVWNPRKKAKERKVKLSWVGVREVARSRGNIILDPAGTEESNGFVRVVFKATDLKRNFTVFGGCHQPKQQKIKDVDKETGEVIGYHDEPDDFYFQKALSKAQRNALNLCIPGDYAAKCIDRFLRLAGKAPLLTQGKAQPTTEPPNKAQAKLQIKPREEWDKVTKEELTTLDKLAQVVWNLTKMQPNQLWRELGYSTRADVTESPWELFLTLKEQLAPES